LIGGSAAMHEVYKMVEKIAPTDLPVLIQGETGTGKELIAHAIHNNSIRAKNVWLAFNCAALPQTLLESELFGYAKGAFTGAVADKKGYLEIASEGTLFIDEIADMPMVMQQKLLRALEEKQIRRIGAEKPVFVNPRFVFACNRNLEELVKNKLFREDLFYRMNAIVINLPSLRERKEDIPALVNHFLKKYSVPNEPMEITGEVMDVLCGWDWPGNIRELENEMKKICVLNKDSRTVQARMISETIRNRSTSTACGPGKGRTLKELRENFERETILDTLRRKDGNVTRTAHELGYARPSFYEKMKQLGIAPETK
ncbi:MAG: sigma-54-dependent Fis family transcriptional regulator, partial [Planctomycetes bacterium]|nr:sigma-54-dependent Fis family transcriptional regulator [Planctomycetota bacterium]